MKKLLSLTLGTAIALSLFTGCATNPNVTPEQQAALRASRMAAVVETVAFNGTKAALIYNPEYRPAITAGNAGLTLLLSTNVTLADFTNIIAQLDLKAPEGKYDSLIRENAEILFEQFARENLILNIDAQVWLRPIVVAVNRGIARGLQ